MILQYFVSLLLLVLPVSSTPVGSPICGLSFCGAQAEVSCYRPLCCEHVCEKVLGMCLQSR